VSAMSRKPIGSEWRLGLDGPGRKRNRIISRDYLTSIADPSDRRAERETVDEFVLLLGPGNECIHIERMDTNTWFVGIGEEKRMVLVGRNGKITVGEMYK